MRKKIFFLVIILILLLSFMVFTKYNNKDNIYTNTYYNDTISIMYTDKYYNSTYSIYDTYSKSIENILTRKNENYSDFNIDQKNNFIYFSDLIDSKYTIYKVDLSNKNKKEFRLLENNYSGDIFDLNDDKLIFRTLTNDRVRYTIGTYSLADESIKIWHNQDEDSFIYNFYWNKKEKSIYTIERSVKEMESTQIPVHKIFKYNEDGENKKLLYSTDKVIDNISVNEQGTKILLDTSIMKNGEIINQINLLDLNNNTDKVIIEPNNQSNQNNFNTIKNPQFSLNKDGFYFLATTPKSKVIENLEGSNPIMSNSIYYYDFISNKTYIIFESDEFVINNFKIN